MEYGITNETITVSSSLIKFVIAVGVLFLIYFFSHQFHLLLARIVSFFRGKLGIFAVSKEYSFQRYVYQHSSSKLAKLYYWVNNQLIVLGLKKAGVTVVGYLLFWAFIALVATCIVVPLLEFGGVFFPLIFAILFVFSLILTRVIVSEKLEKRELDIMNAIDLIVPELHSGVKNAILTYKDNFDKSIQGEFMVFLANIQDRGYSFEDAMYILADSLGVLFQDFAQKAIYFERIGELDMLDIFSDITESNRLRRQLRSENNLVFRDLRTTFIVSTVLCIGYFIFMALTDAFTRYFFLVSTVGRFLLLIIVVVILAVLSYIATIKSRAL